MNHLRAPKGMIKARLATSLPERALGLLFKTLFLTIAYYDAGSLEPAFALYAEQVDAGGEV